MLLLCVLIACACREPAPAPAADSPQAPALFAEITGEVGLPEPAPLWADGTYFLPEIMGPGVALLDYDADGDLDLLQIRLPPPGQPDAPAPNRLYRQEPGGTFVDVSAESGLEDPGFGQGVAVGDVDNDGDLDVYLANYGPDALYVNAGDGSFSRSPQTGFADDLWSAAATFCDYDGDGDQDLYVAHYLNYDIQAACRGPKGSEDYCGPSGFDGVADRLYRNDGEGAFSDVTREAGVLLRDGGKRAKGLGVVCLDLTGDGRVDFYVANDGEANQLWVNQGDGSFADEATIRGIAVNRRGNPEASMGIATGDVNADGRVDLFLTHLTMENNTLYTGEPSGLFIDRTVSSGMRRDDLSLTGFGCSLLDFDLDGDLDLALVNGRVLRSAGGEQAAGDGFWSQYAEPNLLFLNDGGGVFSRAGRLGAGLEVSRGLAAGDLDGDGDLDLAVSNADNSVRIYRNEAERAGRHWLRVRAVEGVREALGARVTVFAGSLRLARAVLAGRSYMSSDPATVHFGLGEESRVDRIEVVWTDGERETFQAGGVDRELVLRRGGGAGG